MKVNVYSIYDSKVSAFLNPFFSATHGSAIRSLTASMDDVKSPFRRFPADYTLFHIGVFDDTSGKLIPETTPVSLGIVQEFLSTNGG